MAQELQRRLEKMEPAHYVRDSDLEAARRVESILWGWHREMSTDFNLGGAQRYLWELTNIYYSEVQYSESGYLLAQTYRALASMNRVYAVLDDILAPERAAPGEAIDPFVDLIVEVRSELRRRKMYDLADRIRERLLELGIIVMDYKDRSEWRRR